MKLSEKGRQLLIKLEGKESRAYADVAKYTTIGVGHLLTAEEIETGKIIINDAPVSWTSGLTNQQMDDLLTQDIDKFEQAVNSSVEVPLSQHQFDALVSFSFNVGISAFKKSTLLRELNKGNYHKVPEQLARWNKAGGKVIKGLINRRREEAKLWRSADIKPVHKSRTNQASAAITAGAITNVIAEATMVKDAVNNFTNDLGEIAQWVGLAVVFVGVAYVLYARYDDRRRGIR